MRRRRKKPSLLLIVVAGIIIGIVTFLSGMATPLPAGDAVALAAGDRDMYATATAVALSVRSPGSGSTTGDDASGWPAGTVNGAPVLGRDAQPTDAAVAQAMAYMSDQAERVQMVNAWNDAPGDSSASASGSASTAGIPGASDSAADSAASSISTLAATEVAAVSLPRPEIPEGTSLFIPSAGIVGQVVETYLDGNSWDVSRLGQNVGHLQGTAWVDEPGNVVLSGHVELSDGRKGIFANLNELSEGDLVVISSDDVERRYIIISITTTTPDDLSPVYPSAEDRLTLITCSTYNFLLDSYLERTIIVAEPIARVAGNS